MYKQFAIFVKCLKKKNYEVCICKQIEIHERTVKSSGDRNRRNSKDV